MVKLIQETLSTVAQTDKTRKYVMLFQIKKKVKVVFYLYHYINQLAGRSLETLRIQTDYQKFYNTLKKQHMLGKTYYI